MIGEEFYIDFFFFFFFFFMILFDIDKYEI